MPMASHAENTTNSAMNSRKRSRSEEESFSESGAKPSDHKRVRIKEPVKDDEASAQAGVRRMMPPWAKTESHPAQDMSSEETAPTAAWNDKDDMNLFSPDLRDVSKPIGLGTEKLQTDLNSPSSAKAFALKPGDYGQGRDKPTHRAQLSYDSNIIASNLKDSVDATEVHTPRGRPGTAAGTSPNSPTCTLSPHLGVAGPDETLEAETPKNEKQSSEEAQPSPRQTLPTKIPAIADKLKIIDGESVYLAEEKNEEPAKTVSAARLEKQTPADVDLSQETRKERVARKRRERKAAKAAEKQVSGGKGTDEVFRDWVDGQDPVATELGLGVMSKYSWMVHGSEEARKDQFREVLPHEKGKGKKKAIIPKVPVANPAPAPAPAPAPFPTPASKNIPGSKYTDEEAKDLAKKKGLEYFGRGMVKCGHVCSRTGRCTHECCRDGILIDKKLKRAQSKAKEDTTPASQQSKKTVQSDDKGATVSDAVLHKTYSGRVGKSKAALTKRRPSPARSVQRLEEAVEAQLENEETVREQDIAPEPDAGPENNQYANEQELEAALLAGFEDEEGGSESEEE